MLQFLCSKGVRSTEIYGRMTIQYDSNCISQRQVYKWVEIFKIEHMNVDDDVNSVWALNATCAGVKSTSGTSKE